MRRITLSYRKRRSLSCSGDSYSHLWFNYHRLFFGYLISKGKKIKAFNKFVELKSRLKTLEEIDPYLVFLVAMIRITPVIYLRPLRLGSFTQGLPLPITENKRATFAVKWIIKLAKRKNRKISIKDLANLMVLSIYNKGPVIELKKNTYTSGRMNRHLIKYFK